MGKFVLSQETINFNAEESWKTITYEAEGVSDIHIYRCDRSYGSADMDTVTKKIYVHAFANYDASRNFHITIRYTEDGTPKYKTFTVFQGGNFDEAEGLFFTNTSDLVVPSQGTTDIMTVAGISGNSETVYTDTLTDASVGVVQQGLLNNNLSVRIDEGGDWITKVNYNSTHGIVYVKAQANTGDNERRGKITIYGVVGNRVLSQTLTVKQESNVPKIYDLTLDKYELDIQATDDSTFQVLVTNAGDETITVSTDSPWINAFVPRGGAFIGVYCSTNPDVTRRVGYVTVTGGANTKPATLKVTQYGQFQTIIFPIWKDTFVEYIPNNKNIGYVSYKIVVGGKEIYNGRIYKIRGNFKIKINDILSDHIQNNIELSTDWSYEYPNESYVQGYVYVSEDDWKTQDTVEKFYTYDNWSYEDVEHDNLSNPINGRIAFGMYGIWTKLNTSFTSTMTTKMHFDDIPHGGDTYTFGNGVYTTLMKVGTHESKKLLVDVGNTFTFDIIPTCSRYAVYYVNKYGGWDSFLFEGKEQMSENYTIHQYQKSYDNSNKQNRGRVQYQKDVKQTWALNTGYMTDEQSAKMDNLYGTTQCYLHDLHTGEIRAVNVTDVKFDVKTFRNQGRKFYNYTINFENSDWDRKRK